MWKAFRVKQSLENGITEEKNKSGFRKKMISVQLLIVLVAVMLFCSGCAGKMNAKKIFRQSSENMQKVTSSANHVELAIQMSDILNLMEVNMEMDLENTTEPPAGHAKGTARVTIKDSEVSADLELYQVEKDPYETENLVFDPGYDAKTEELLKLLRIHMEEMNDEQKVKEICLNEFRDQYNQAFGKRVFEQKK